MQHKLKQPIGRFKAGETVNISKQTYEHLKKVQAKVQKKKEKE